MYLIYPNLDLSVIGFYPQTEGSTFHLHAQDEKVCQFLTSADEKFEGDLQLLGHFSLARKAKITDYINTSGYLLITEKILNILLNFNIKNYQYFKVQVSHRKNFYDYYIFIIYGNDYSIVDYKNMTFIAETQAPYSDYYREPHEQVGTQKKIVKIQSYKELFYDVWPKLYPDFPRWSYQELILKNENISTDMIKIPKYFGISYLVSERLKNAIIEEGCTGIDFKTEEANGKIILYS